MLNISSLRNAPFSIIGVPIDSVGRGGGTELSPICLRELGDWRRVAISDHGDLDINIRNSEWHPETGIIGSNDVIHVTNVLRYEIAHCFRKGYRPILLGGCCTQVVGAIAGARDIFGRIGLLYLDGHLDLYDGFTSPTGEAADMPLATLLGRGPSQWINAAGGACIDSADIVLLGPRDVEDATLRGSLLPEDFDPPIPLWTNVDIQTKGPAQVADNVISKFLNDTRPLWLAIDVDVLDQTTFSATDYLMPNGLIWDDFSALLKNLVQYPDLLGVSIACYNPEKDPGYFFGKKLVQLIIQSLEGRVS